MNTTETPSKEYLLLFRGAYWDEGLSDNDAQALMDRVMAWFESVNKKSKVKGGHALAQNGRVMSVKQGKNVADGPFVESKEAVGGYLLLEADSIEEVVELVKTNPTLQHGITVEIRPALTYCPVFQRIKERLAVAAA